MTDIPRQDISLVRGDDWGPYRWTASTGNLTGCKLWMTLKRSSEDADPGVLQLDSDGNGIVIVDALNADFEITAAQAAALPGLPLLYDVQVRTPAGKIYTALRGQVFVDTAADITRTTT